MEEHSDGCPRCGERAPIVPKDCICGKPLNIWVPPGHHIHLQCPVHGDVKVSGQPVTWKEE